MSRKEVDDVLGGEDSWKNVDSTEGNISLVLLCSSSCTDYIFVYFDSVLGPLTHGFE